MKKKLIVLAAVVVCIAIAASGTLAYFTSQEEVHNVITTNGVDIAIEEWQEDENGKLVDYPDAPVEAMPGVTVSKIAKIKNLQAEAWIRAKFEVVVTQADGTVMDLSDEELAKVINVAVPDDKWTADDGWYYYSDAVATGASTYPLFTEVVFDGINMTNEYQNCTVEVVVYAQGVQTANNGATVAEADGWPDAVIQ